MEMASPMGETRPQRRPQSLASPPPQQHQSLPSSPRLLLSQPLQSQSFQLQRPRTESLQSLRSSQSQQRPPLMPEVQPLPQQLCPQQQGASSESQLPQQS